MRSILKTGCLMAVAALFHGAVWAASFTAALDRDTITLGEQTTLSLKFDGVQPDSAPRIPAIPGLQIQYIGPSSSFSFVNGETSASITFNYVVTAQHDGRFLIPAMRANVNGQQFTSGALTLAVTKATAPSAADEAAGNQPAFLKLELPKPQVYVGEPIVARIELYLRDDVQDLRGFQFTSSPTDGFTAGKTMEQPNSRRRVQIGNHLYTVIPLALPLTADRAGALTVGPFTASVMLIMPSGDQGGDQFFRQFFNQGVQQQVSVATDPVKIQALPLPDQNKPADFTGAVGDFTLNVSAGPTNVTVGDPITLRAQISGHGTLDSLSLPLADGWRDFKTFPATTKVETADQLGFQGTKTFEQIVSPENADIHELPPLSFSYFNPDDGHYHTLTQPATPITVKAAGATPVPTLAGAKSAAPENQSPTDILPIKENLGTLVAERSPLIAQPTFLAAQSLPLLAFLAAFIWRTRADRLANNPRLRRHRAVAQLTAAGLLDLKKHAAANRPDEFFAVLFRLLQEQLGERLDCPASAITENIAEEHPLLRAAPATLRDALREQFQLCNQARYAPVRGVSELNSVAAQFEKVIRDLQELKP